MPLIDTLVLNPVQREAVLYNEGPELVFAGAGTGKTRVLTAKIAWLIEQGMYPGEIFAATFTNKAAREMRSRVESLTGLSTEGMWIGTFHSMCARILRREGSVIGFMPGFTIYDTADQRTAIKKVLASLGIDDRSMPYRQVLAAISGYKNRCVPPEALEGQERGFYGEELVRVYKAYQTTLLDAQAMDFDDLLSNTVYCFQKAPQVLRRYQECFKQVLVDEYQDTNTAQFLFLKLIAQQHGRVFVVGDDDQSIYGWRGAQVENILSFESQFPRTRVFTLEQNYRSTGVILTFANAAISANAMRSPKNLWTALSGGERVTVNRFRDDRQEAESVADRIQGLIAGGTKATAIAVLFRTNAQSRAFEEVLRRRRIPYVIVGGMSFYERAEIKDCLAYLRLLVNPKDNVAFERIVNVPPRGLGEKAYEALAAVAAQKKLSPCEALLTSDMESFAPRYRQGFADIRDLLVLLGESVQNQEPVSAMVNDLLKLSGYMDMLTQEDTEEAAGRIENLNEFTHVLHAWSEEHPGRGLADFLEEVTLATDVDTWEARDEAVNLMTMHCAKGLEFEAVFLVGLEEGLIPSRRNIDDEKKIEEERRLFYVGITRAEKQLECSFVDCRWRFGDMVPGYPSRFLESIPQDAYLFRDRSNYYDAVLETAKTVQRPAAGPKKGPRRLTVPANRQRAPLADEFSQEPVEFRMGQPVTHKTYGRGRIVSISGFGDDMKLTVLFNNGTRKRLMAKFANFEASMP
ncbi:MAG: UvrD-helicase domain-containing protein [Chitinispirillaceae bacterium]|nr:UvrD-helicase domain-containing protein [Chitinispirillaceae bacterium]